ncbi:MAG: toll/interleukin-1 receptor domain-containing protein, partial [Bacteroidota bacterium]
YNCKVLIKLDFNNLEILVFIISQKEKKNVPVVAKSIFKEILELYWDRSFAKNDIEELSKSTLEKIMDFDVSKFDTFSPIESPQDLYISVDNENFVHHQTLENKEKTRSSVAAFGLTSAKEIQHGKEVTFRKLDKTNVKNFPSILFNNYTSNPNVNRMKKVFISFSRKDVAYKDELKKHLKILETFEISDNWSCEEITIGQWHSQIQKELEESDLIIYMLSANFLSSRYILEEEVKKGMDLIAEDTSKKVLCVIVSEFVGLDNLRLAMENRATTEVQDAVLKLSEYQYLPYGQKTNTITGNEEKKIVPLKEYQNIEKALAQVTQMVLDYLRG